MNVNLTNEIVKHIFNFFGFSKNENQIQIQDLSKFLLTKKITIELDDNSKYEADMWGFCAKINNIKFTALIANIGTEIDQPEYILLFQLDNLTTYVIKLNRLDLSNQIFCLYDENKWIAISSLLQAKLLVGFEQLSELFISWEKLDNYDNLYKKMVAFLNFDENT